jgi:glycosyltransferase involved in cell wall biosynthesis
VKVAVWHDLHSGGAKRALYNHVAGLSAAGHEVAVWTPCARDRDFADLSEFAVEHVLPLPISDHWSIRERAGVARRSRRVLAAMDAHCRRCAAEMEAKGFDIVFANSSYRVSVSSIARATRLPSLIYHQEPSRKLYEAIPGFVWAAPPPFKHTGISKRILADRLQDWKFTRNGRLYLREEIANVRAFDKILCNSFYSRESLIRAYGVEADVCYLGVDADQFVPSDAARSDYVIGLGSFYEIKNPRLCIEALGAMPAPRPRLVWVCNIKDDRLVGELAALATQRGVVLDIRVAIPDAELQTLLSGALTMVYTSRLEPFGFAPLEANACGTPVVAVAEGGVRETIRDGVNGLMTDGMPASLAAAIARLRDDPALADLLGRQGREIVRSEWTPQLAASRLIDKLDEVRRAGKRRG